MSAEGLMAGWENGGITMRSATMRCASRSIIWDRAAGGTISSLYPADSHGHDDRRLAGNPRGLFLAPDYRTSDHSGGQASPLSHFVSGAGSRGGGGGGGGWVADALKPKVGLTHRIAWRVRGRPGSLTWPTAKACVGRPSVLSHTSDGKGEGERLHAAMERSVPLSSCQPSRYGGRRRKRAHPHPTHTHTPSPQVCTHASCARPQAHPPTHTHTPVASRIGCIRPKSNGRNQGGPPRNSNKASSTPTLST